MKLRIPKMEYWAWQLQRDQRRQRTTCCALKTFQGIQVPVASWDLSCTVTSFCNGWVGVGPLGFFAYYFSEMKCGLFKAENVHSAEIDLLSKLKTQFQSLLASWDSDPCLRLTEMMSLRTCPPSLTRHTLSISLLLQILSIAQLMPSGRETS